MMRMPEKNKEPVNCDNCGAEFMPTATGRCPKCGHCATCPD